MELHPLVREILFCCIPTHKVLLRYDINLGAFRAARSAAVVMPTAQRRVICHDILRSQNQLSKQCLIVSSTLDDKIISHCHSLVISKDLPKCFRMFHPVCHPIFYISSRIVRTSRHEAVSPEGAARSRMDMIVMASLRKR